jgi:hypothetical protein
LCSEALAYLETVVRRITTPRLEKLGIQLFKGLTVSVPQLLQFSNLTENLRFSNAKFKFFDEIVVVGVCLREEAERYPLTIVVDCWPLDLRVSSVAHVFNSLG